MTILKVSYEFETAQSAAEWQDSEDKKFHVPNPGTYKVREKKAKKAKPFDPQIPTEPGFYARDGVDDYILQVFHLGDELKATWVTAANPIPGGDGWQVSDLKSDWLIRMRYQFHKLKL